MPYPATADNTFERWPAPPRRTVRSPLEGQEILSEVPPPLAGLLWTAYRFTTLWAEAAPAERPNLHHAAAEGRWADHVRAAGLDSALQASLLDLGSVLRGASARVDEVADALGALVRHCWAQNWRASAAVLAEPAARLVPGNLDAIYEAGRAARRAGWEREGDAWFRHGLSLARRRRNGGESARFLSSLGNAALQRGNLRLAERLHLRALRAARRASAHGRAGAAAHDLMVIALHRDDPRPVERWASVALDAYGPQNPAARVVVHDLAYFWMERGHFAAAYPVMAALLPHFRPDDGPPEVTTLGNLARAAAGAGDREAFEGAWAEVVRRLEANRSRAGWAAALANALSEMARGALQIGDPERALWAVEQAEPLARAAGLGRERLVLESVREAAERGASRTAPAAGRPVEASPERDALAGRCLALLHAGPEVAA